MLQMKGSNFAFLFVLLVSSSIAIPVDDAAQFLEGFVVGLAVCFLI